MQRASQGVGGAAVHVVPADGLYPTLPSGEMDTAKIAEVEQEARDLGFTIDLSGNWLWRSSKATQDRFPGLPASSSIGFDSYYLAALDAVESVRENKKMRNVARAALRELAINERLGR